MQASKLSPLLLSAAVVLAAAAPVGVGATAADGAIAFESTRTGDSDIWITTPDGAQQTNLTRTPGVQESSPALSPDGRRVAFVRSSGDRYRLWIMNSDGSGQRLLGASKGSDLNPVWAPTGDRIAFVTLLGRNWDVYVTTLNGARTRLTTDSAAEVDVSWDPNGDRVVVDRIEKGTSDLWFVSVPDGKLERLTSTPRLAELNPAWSPKGGEVAYDATVGGVYDLFAVDVAGGKVRRLTRDAADDGDPVWAPDASALAYRRGVGPDYEIAIVDASGTGKPRNLSRDPAGIDVAPTWSAAARQGAVRVPAGSERVAVINWVFACDAAWPGTVNVDNYTGNANVNRMCGDGAGDTIRGMDEGDWLSGGSSTDYLYGQNGGDKLKARDSTKDYVRGSYGVDYALLDGNDDVTGVENPAY